MKWSIRDQQMIKFLLKTKTRQSKTQMNNYHIRVNKRKLKCLIGKVNQFRSGNRKDSYQFNPGNLQQELKLRNIN